MPALLALVSLLGGCSGMLDLPDGPRVNLETTAPLEPAPRHGDWSDGHEPGSTGGFGAEKGESPARREPDAGAASEEDAGSVLRLGAR